MCCGPYDYHYPTFGGKHQRTDPTHGRVGSLFSDPNTTLGPSADSNLVPHPAVEAPSVPEDEDIDEDVEDLDLDGDDDVGPLDRLDDDDIDELPEPDLDEESEVTASRPWRQRPLRQNFEYR